MSSTSPIIHLCYPNNIRINPINTYDKHAATLPEGCPTWASSYQQEKWCERGITISDDRAHTIEHIGALRALLILESMRTSDRWQSEGLNLPPNIFQSIPEYPVEPRKSKKTGRKVLTTPKSTGDKAEDILLHLSIILSKELFALLEKHETLIREIAKDDKENAEQVLEDVYELLRKIGADSKLHALDLPQRKWCRAESNGKLKCGIPAAQTFNTLLKERRAEAGLSYHQLSERTDIDTAYILSLEHGTKNNPSRDIVIRLGIGLGLDVQEIDELVTSAGHLSLIRFKRKPVNTKVN